MKLAGMQLGEQFQLLNRPFYGLIDYGKWPMNNSSLLEVNSKLYYSYIVFKNLLKFSNAHERVKNGI